MHRAEKTSSKICRDRELNLVKSIHHKKLEETRSAIDTSKPKTSSMYHMKRNKRRERLLKEQAVEIHRNNHLLVHRMKDVLECSAWEFYPCTSVNDTSYTVYHSSRSPRKPPGPPPASSTSPSKSRKAPAASLNAPFRSRQLKQIKSENAAHQQRLRQSQTHYKNAQLSKEYKQSVKYLESICAFPLIQGGATSPRHKAPKPPPPLLLDEDDDDDEDNLLEFYNMTLPTIHIPKEPKNTAANGTSLPQLSPSTCPSGGGVPKLKCYMGPQQPPRPRLPSLDPLSPRFKWGPHGAPHLEPTPTPPSASHSEDENAYKLKQCRRIDGVEFVVTALSGQTYGLVLQAHETKAKHRRHIYELFVSKDHILELLEGSASSVADEFSVHGISHMLCDKLRYAPSALSIPLTLSRPHESLQTSIFCRFELVSLADNLPPFVVSMASTEDGSICFTTEHPMTQESHRLIKSAADILAFLKSHKATPGQIETLEDAAVAALPFLTVANGRLTLQVREKTAVKAKPEPCPSERAQAAATIQATMRAAILRKLFLDKKNAVHVIKTTYLRRLHQAKRAKKRQHQPIVLKGSSKEFKLSSTITAAVTIQRIVRGFLARHMVHEALERQRIIQERLVQRGLSKIQAHVGGANVRRQSLRRQYSQRDKGEAWPQEIHVDANTTTAAAAAATLIQKRIRGTLARKSRRMMSSISEDSTRL
ncbi:hypothetical protein AC1031_009188 [Aphanomyces cochlioides]|nr:hypothetical protein AC1031_009188 [Aphanomyces cochlioides]